MTIPSSGSALAASPVGVVPIVWNNADLPDLSAPVDPSTVLDEIARLGFAGCQHGVGFPDGPGLVRDLERRGLRLAEVYAAIPCDASGPRGDAREIVLSRLHTLNGGDGDVLVLALHVDPIRSSFAGRSAHPACPTLSDSAWLALERLLQDIVSAADEVGRQVSFHPHVGTYVENTQECRRLFETLEGTSVGLCLDVGHWLLAGGSPEDAIREYADLVTHVHLKDVDEAAHGRLLSGELAGFEEAIHQRVFTELGAGSLDIFAVLESLTKIGYGGWLMVEQDSSWLSPSESAAVSLHTLRFAMKNLNR